MLVVTFAVTGARNCVVADGTPYVWARTDDGPFVLPARCPHRGGPLNLAAVEDEGPSGARLVCPWHGGRTLVRRHSEAGVPAVRRGDTVTAVLPLDPESPWHTEHRPVSADLGGAACRAGGRR